MVISGKDIYYLNITKYIKINKIMKSKNIIIPNNINNNINQLFIFFLKIPIFFFSSINLFEKIT